MKVRMPRVRPFLFLSSKGSGLGRFVIAIVLVFSLLFISRHPYTEMLKGSEGCRRCHGEIYREATAKPYRHSVVEEKCAVCHIEKEPVTKEKVISSGNYQKEFLFVLRGILKDLSYRMNVILFDSSGTEGEPVTLEFSPAEIESNPAGSPVIRPAVPVISLPRPPSHGRPTCTRIRSWSTA
jgi:hypothetical protein